MPLSPLSQTHRPSSVQSHPISTHTLHRRGLAERTDSMVMIQSVGPQQSWLSWIGSIPSNIAHFIKERVFLDSILWVRSFISVVRDANPQLVRKRVQEVNLFRGVMEASGTSRDQRETVQTNFNRLRGGTKDLFQRITGDVMIKYVNATSAEEIQETKARLVRECQSFISAQNGLLGMSTFMALIRGKTSTNPAPLSAEPIPASTSDPAPAPTAADSILLSAVGAEERARTKQMDALALILPDAHQLKTDNLCSVTYDMLSAPVYHTHQRIHRNQQEHIVRIATTNTYAARPVCPACRNPIEESGLRFDVAFQKELFQKAAEAVVAMTDAAITTQLTEVLANWQTPAGGSMTAVAAKNKLSTAIQDLPEHVTVNGAQKEIRSRVLARFTALP